MQALFIGLSILIGLCQVCQAGVNRNISKHIGLPAASVLNNVLGCSCAVLVYFVEDSQKDSLPDAWENRGDFSDMRWWWVLPGFFGFFIVVSIPWGIARMGAFRMFATMIAAELVAGLAWDAIFEGKPVGLVRAMTAVSVAIGAAIVFGAAALTRRFGGGGGGGSSGGGDREHARTPSASSPSLSPSPSLSREDAGEDAAEEQSGLPATAPGSNSGDGTMVVAAKPSIRLVGSAGSTKNPVARQPPSPGRKTPLALQRETGTNATPNAVSAAGGANAKQHLTAVEETPQQLIAAAEQMLAVWPPDVSAARKVLADAQQALKLELGRDASHTKSFACSTAALMELLPVFIGVCRVAQGSTNRLVAKQWGLPKTAMLSMSVFLVLGALLYWATQKRPDNFDAIFTSRESYSGNRWWYGIPALCGFIVVFGLPWTIANAGALVVFTLLIVTEIVSSFAWDAIVERVPVNRFRVMGMIIVIVGAVLQQTLSDSS